MHQGQRHFPSRAMVYYGPGPSLPQWFVKASQAKTETVAVGFELRLGLWLMIRLCDLNSFSSHELDLFSPLACLQLDAIRSSGSVGRKHVGVDGHFSAITTCVKLWSFKQKRWLSGEECGLWSIFVEGSSGFDEDSTATRLWDYVSHHVKHLMLWLPWFM